MHWRVKLQDNNGCFWLTARGERFWSDDSRDALQFLTESAARYAAGHARCRVAMYIDWFPRVSVVEFSGPPNLEHMESRQ